MNRCVNIDWLQVFCKEPDSVALDANYFKSKGYQVKERDYGTPQYRQMFTVYEDGFPFVEVRRDPYSLKVFGGIFDKRDCHLRLSNRACYSVSPIDDLRKFIITHGYSYQSISRIDICLDFNVFDFGDKPEKILKDYMEGKYSKINQCNIAAHGKDRFAGRLWNSLSWGSKNSPVSTKMYNKSLELKETNDKFYICDAWVQAGLRIDVDVWRVEFSIKSDVKGFIKTETGELIENKLTNYDDRLKCLFRFHSLAAKYFHFKFVEYQENGKLRRKDRCRDKVLFIVSKEESAYKPLKLTMQHEPTRTDKMLVNRLHAIISNYKMPAATVEAAKRLITFYNMEMRLPMYSPLYDKLVLSYE